MTNQYLQTALFAAANSGEGFRSFYGDIFDTPKICRRYLIKGGPGTGKSTLMRKVCAGARAEGLGVEEYICSSDPYSLDGIIIDGSVAVIDATPPHAIEPQLAGARDIIVDTGAFWNADSLFSKQAEISELSQKKSNCYRSAYRFLSAAAALDNENRSIGAAALREDKLRRAAERICRAIGAGDGFRMSVGLCSSVGMRGRVRVSTYERRAEVIYIIEDFFSTGSRFLSAVIDAAARQGNRITVSYSHLVPDHPDAVYFEDRRVALVCPTQTVCIAEGKLVRRVNMKRFADAGELTKSKRASFAANRRLCDGLLQSAADVLAEAGEYHFALERIYGESMDFAAFNSYAEELARRIIEKCRQK